MAKPTPEAFAGSVRKSLAQVLEGKDLETALEVLESKGPSFDFYDDGNIDSLDMLDIAYYIDHDLKIRLGLEELMHSDKPMTVQNLFDSIRHTSTTPA